jgi:two-component system response regulator FixJ
MREVLDARQRVANLTRREREVLEAVVAGHSNKTIAYKLSISARTVEMHRARMLHRLGAPNVPASIRMAVIAESGRYQLRA